MPDEYDERPEDEHSLSHEQIAKAGLSEPADFMQAPTDGWSEDRVFDLGDGRKIRYGDLK